MALLETPPMGWNSWNVFRWGTVNAAAVLETAVAMVDSGMRDAGYEYVVIDDHWQASRRSADGSLEADPRRFPDGIAAVVDGILGLGIKAGIYSCPGARQEHP